MRSRPRGVPAAESVEAPAATDLAPAPDLLGLFTQALLRTAAPSGEPVDDGPEGLTAMICRDLATREPRCARESEVHVATPRWGAAPEAPFQAIAVGVAGVRLVAPLTGVEGVVDVPRKLSHLPGMDPWILGVFRHRAHSVRVVDTARLLGIDTRDTVRPLRRALLMGPWGLAFDGEDSVLDLAPSDLRWRSARPVNPWMAGIVLSLMSPLVDVSELIRRLEGEGAQAELARSLLGKQGRPVHDSILTGGSEYFGEQAG